MDARRLAMNKIEECEFNVSPRTGGIYHAVQTTYTIGDNAEYRVVDLRYDDTPDIPRLTIFRNDKDPDRYLPEIEIDRERDKLGWAGPISFTIGTENFGNMSTSAARQMIADYEFTISVAELLEQTYLKKEG